MIHRWGSNLLCEANIYLTWSISEPTMRLVPSNMFRPQYFIDVFQGGASFEDPFLLFGICVCLSYCPLQPFGNLLGKGWPLGSLVSYNFVCLSLSHMVSWVRCGIWLHRFLIFAFFFTLEMFGDYSAYFGGCYCTLFLLSLSSSFQSRGVR